MKDLSRSIQLLHLITQDSYVSKGGPLGGLGASASLSNWEMSVT